jgi:molecular chaperone GrpE
MSMDSEKIEPTYENVDRDRPIEPEPTSEGQQAPEPQTPEQVMQAAAAKLTELQAEVADYRDRWMRAEAEIANVRARAKREVDDTRQYAVQKFARDVVEAADTLRRGLDAIPRQDGEPEIVARVREGFEGVERSLLSILERNGVKREDPTGSTFDPNLHQAMGEQETDQHPAGTVVQAWTPAWTLNGRLLRPAMVVVAKPPATAQANGAAQPRLDRTA